MKIGIIGSGLIVNWALETISKIDTIECTALWHRGVDKSGAAELQRKYNISKLYTDLDYFLSDDSFDTVYVGVINSLHYFNTKKALLAGKNVICEKPFSPSGQEAQELLDLAKQKSLFLFEAIMLRYAKNYELIKEKISELGEIRMVSCNYSQYSRRYDKYKEGVVLPAFDPDFAGGCIYDINIYCIHFVMGIFGKPKEFKYYPTIGFNGIDLNGVLVLDYGNFKAICTGAKDSNSKPYCSIQGENGYIHLDSVPGLVNNVVQVMNHEDPVSLGENVNDAMTVEFKKINEIIQNSNYELCYHYMEQTVDVMDVVEKARKEAGIYFKDDK